MIKSNFEVIGNYLIITNYDATNLKLINNHLNTFNDVKIIFNKITETKTDYIIKLELTYKNYLTLKQTLKINKKKNFLVELKDSYYYHTVNLLFNFDNLNIVEKKPIQFTKLNEIQLLINFYSYFNKKEFDDFNSKYYNEFPYKFNLKYNILNKKLSIIKENKGSEKFMLDILNTRNCYINNYLFGLFGSNAIFNIYSPIALKLAIYSILKQCPEKLKRIDKIWRQSANFQ